MDEEIKSYNWNEILNKLNTEESFNVFSEALIRAFNTHMPERSKRLGNEVTRNEPWITNGIKTTITKQKKLYKRTLLEKSNPSTIEKYKAYRNMLQRIKRKAKIQYYRSRCKEFRNDTRKLWNLINTITGKIKK